MEGKRGRRSAQEGRTTIIMGGEEKREGEAEAEEGEENHLHNKAWFCG